MKYGSCFALALLVGAFMLAGCSDDDSTAPPKPRIDPVESPTNNLKPIISGTAEPNATITIAGGTNTVTTTSDPFTARWYATIELNPNTTNSLSVIAADAAGNKSEPATAEIVTVSYAPGDAAAIKMTLLKEGDTTPLSDPAKIAVGDNLIIQAVVTDGGGNTIDTPVTITTSIPDAVVEGTKITSISHAGTFKVVATALNTNLYAAATVEVSPGAAATIQLSLQNGYGVPITSAKAGEQVQVVVKQLDAFGNEVTATLPKLEFTPALTAYAGTAPCNQSPALMCDPASPNTCSHTFIACNVEGLTNNKITFKATADTLTPVTADLNLKPAAASKFKANSFEFSPTGSGATKTVLAGTSVDYLYTVTDVYGNTTTGPVTVVTNAPGAVILDDGVSGKGTIANLNYVGNYSVRGLIAGVGEAGSLTLNVGVGPGSTMTVTNNSSLTSINSDVTVFAVIRDPYGNQIKCDNTTLSRVTWLAKPPTSGQGPKTGSAACQYGAFTAVFAFGADGTYAIEATYADGVISLTGSTYVQVLTFDNVKPTVSVSNITINGAACVPAGSPLGCSVGPRDIVGFDVIANDNSSLSEVDYSVYFETTSTLINRVQYISQDATLPVTIHFFFRVPVNVGTEDVSLVALAVDGAGNRATSTSAILHVSQFTLSGGRTGTIVTEGGLINSPTDVALDSSLNVFVGNDGDNNLLRIVAGGSTAQTFSSYNGGTSFMTVDGTGNIYINDGNQLSKIDAAGTSAGSYLTYSQGRNGQGLAIAPASYAKGLVDATNASDSDLVTVGTRTYEINTNGNCTGAGLVCVTVTVGANINQALATAISGDASRAANAAYNTSCGGSTTSCVVLSAPTTGEAGNSIALGASNTTRIRVSSTTLLREGHDEHIWIGQMGTTDTNIYRYPETLTSNPALPTGNHGLFNIGSQQRGVAVINYTTASSANVSDLMVHYITAGQANSALRGYQILDNLNNSTSISQIYSVSRVTNGNNFNTLYDVAVEPATGCLLVSDAGNNQIYSVDVRNRANTNPTVTIVASGFNSLRGLAFGNDGNLYVADRDRDAIIRITPSTSNTDCF